MKLKTLFLLSLVTLLSSCSSYMNSLYRDFEEQDKVNSDVDVANDTFDQFRRHKRRTSTEYNKIDKTVTSSNTKNISPSIKRQYKDEKEVTKRYTAHDLTDNGSDGSLWAGSDPNAFLFSNTKTKTTGDIVQINVLGKLKNEITLELKKAFPDNPYEVRANAEKGDGKGAPALEKKDAAVADAGADGGQDKISGIVVEEINREHLLIKGRKNVLYKNRKRMVEVQALVSRKDVGDNDIVNSDSILESSIAIIK
jgi:flagellar L-ring protein precursor FlgH